MVWYNLRKDQAPYDENFVILFYEIFELQETKAPDLWGWSHQNIM